MSEVNDLKAIISELEKELENKDYEIHGYLDKIEELEEKISKLEYLVSEDSDKKKGKKQQIIDSKLSFIEKKDKEIRELRDRMGFLRKEKVQLQQELEKKNLEIKNFEKESSVIRVEDLREKAPLNILVKELQDKINKQRSEINQLEQKNKDAGNLNEILKEKEYEIETYKSEILELNQKLKDLSSSAEDKQGDSIAKKLIEDLQTQLNKAKTQIIELKKKIAKYEKKLKKKQKKEREPVKKDQIAKETSKSESKSTETMITLQNDLQNKLNKAKMQIKSLEEELKKIKAEKVPEQGKPQEDLEGKLKMQREMAIFLQKQLETKDSEFETIKNEAVQIKKRYRQLESQLKMKDQKIDELLDKLESQPTQILSKNQPQETFKEDSHLSLRLNELKNMIYDLKKRNYEQRIEISQLRKKI
ncbi:MAG: hypothetical protein ACFFB0_04290 [Promethearchaeota archaeon]